MEGQTRPHFFTGVATIVLKLFTHIPANFAIFGEKDYQQLAVIRQMVRDLDLNITILAQPTIRETDGLALSSRNLYLSASDRKLAPLLYAEMQETANQIAKGTPVDAALVRAKTQLTKAGFSKIDYFDLRHSDNLQPAKTLVPNCRIFAAIWLGTTRLIDNYAL
jgi:pantoate--beta-alanine ligase